MICWVKAPQKLLGENSFFLNSAPQDENLIFILCLTLHLDVMNETVLRQKMK